MKDATHPQTAPRPPATPAGDASALVRLLAARIFEDYLAERNRNKSIGEKT